MQEGEKNLINYMVDNTINLLEKDNKTLDKMIDNASDHLLLGEAMVITGTLLTPICPVVGPGLTAFGLGYRTGSLIGGGPAVMARTIKKIQE